MRKLPTDAEKQSAQALAEAFRKEGHSVSFPEREHDDKPDILMEIGGFLIACECTQIPPEYIYQFMHKKYGEHVWRDDESLSILWPNEPHQWIADAIRKKAALAPSYLQRTGASEAWLLVHPPTEITQFLLNSELPWILHALAAGSMMVDHPFAQIHLFTPKMGIQPISVPKLEVGKTSSLEVDFSNGYPTLCLNRFKFLFTTAPTDATEPRITSFVYRYGAPEVITPMDPEYRKVRPATIGVTYKCEIAAWQTHASIKLSAQFEYTDEFSIVAQQEMENLAPNTEYAGHFVHEYAAPRQLFTTIHVNSK